MSFADKNLGTGYHGPCRNCGVIVAFASRDPTRCSPCQNDAVDPVRRPACSQRVSRRAASRIRLAAADAHAAAPMRASKSHMFCCSRGARVSAHRVHKRSLLQLRVRAWVAQLCPVRLPCVQGAGGVGRASLASCRHAQRRTRPATRQAPRPPAPTARDTPRTSAHCAPRIYRGVAGTPAACAARRGSRSHWS